MIYVVGNSISALSAVASISKREKVTWLQKIGRKGGVFGGLDIDGTVCDIGMLNFELGAASNRRTQSVTEYDRKKTNDCANFCEIVNEFVTEFSNLVKLEEPKMLFRGELVPDFLYGHKLDVLSFFQKSVSEAIKSYESDLFEQFHPRHKYEGNFLFEQLNYQDISTRLLGSEVMDEVIKPWLNKTIGIAGSKLPAFRHRAAWAPLYWPESIINFNERSINDFGLSASFSYPEFGTFSSLIRGMYTKTECSDNVDVVLSEQSFSATTYEVLSFADSEKIIACEPLAFGELGINDMPPDPLKTVVDLYYLDVEKGSVFDEIYVVNSCEAYVPWYRASVCDGRVMTNTIKVCVEFKSGVLPDHPEIEDLKLMSLGISSRNSRIAGCFEKIPALNVINDVWDSRYEESLKQFAAKHPKIRFIGGAGGRWGNTFSDQVIQGVKEGRRFE